MNGVGIVSKLKPEGASHPPPPYPCNPAQPVRSGADRQCQCRVSNWLAAPHLQPALTSPVAGYILFASATCQKNNGFPLEILECLDAICN